MDFQPTETRRMLSDTIGRFLEKEYPLSDRVEAGNSEIGYSKAKMQNLAELGIIGALFSEDHGGFGGDGFDIATVFESLGRGLVVEPILDHALMAGHILASTDRAGEVAEIISGTRQVALACFENPCDFDISDVSTTASAQGDGWVLNGAKTSVNFADTADAFVVAANIDGAGGHALFLVPTNAPGITLHSYQTVAGGRASEVAFENVEIGQTALLVSNDQGDAFLLEAIARGIIALCAEALGIMEAIKSMTMEYLQTRKQFGAPIGKFQALQHRMATVLLEIEQARSAVTNAANALDAPIDERERMVSAAKYSIGRIGQLVAEEAIQMHGGIGMTWEYDLGHYAKRLIMIDHELGDQDHHLMRFADL